MCQCYSIIHRGLSHLLLCDPHLPLSLSLFSLPKYLNVTKCCGTHRNAMKGLEQTKIYILTPSLEVEFMLKNFVEYFMKEIKLIHNVP